VDVVRVDTVQRHSDRTATVSGELGYDRSIYGIGYEVKGEQKGDGAPGRNAIEDACTQVMRGVNGFIELLAAHPTLLPLETPTPIIPAIFTTAKLWVSDVDVGGVELTKGTLEPGAVVVKQVPWLWFRYQPSPGITHGLPKEPATDELSRIADMWYTRCVAVVSADGAADFFAKQWKR
jgi:hypothetical protein